MCLDVRNNTKILVDGHDDLSWISSINSSAQHAEVLGYRHPGTGIWFTNKKEVRNWRDSQKQLLYCQGIPGAGKTVLSSVVIEWLTKSFTNEDKVAITYIFFDFRQKLSASEILAALLRQLWQGLPRESRPFPPEKPPQGESTKLAWIQSELQAQVSKSIKTFIILDALDECSVNGVTMRQALEFLFSLQKTANVNILATSRFNEETANMFDKTGVTLEVQANENDIRSYVDSRAEYFAPFVAKRKGLLTYIRDEVARSSKGM